MELKCFPLLSIAFKSEEITQTFVWIEAIFKRISISIKNSDDQAENVYIDNSQVNVFIFLTNL